MAPEEPAPAKPGWRTVRTGRKQKRKEPAPPAQAALAGPVGPDPRRQVSSWATWQRESRLEEYS
jgi:hypothetical protein